MQLVHMQLACNMQLTGAREHGSGEAHGEKLGEIHGPISIAIDFVHHVLSLDLAVTDSRLNDSYSWLIVCKVLGHVLGHASPMDIPIGHQWNLSNPPQVHSVN